MTKAERKGFFLNDWRVSPLEGLLIRDDEVVRVEPKAMEVLVYLASRPNEVITRDILEHDVWRGAQVGYDAVTNTVIKLRKALQDDARQPRLIATIPKKGYQLIASVTYINNGKSSVSVTPDDREPIVEAQRGRLAWSIRRTGMVIATLIGLFVFGLLWLPASLSSQFESIVNNSNANTLPSIVVLPFENLSADPKQDSLAYGITEDLITDLSRLSSLLVIASNTLFTYTGKQISSEDTGTDLRVKFVLKGSIRQLGNEVRVNARLVNAKTGFNVWAQRYDRKLIEVFSVQDEVTQSIVEALAVKITHHEKSLLAKKTTDGLKPVDFVQEGPQISRFTTNDASQTASEVYRKPIEFDSCYGRSYEAMACALGTDFRRGWIATLPYRLWI